MKLKKLMSLGLALVMAAALMVPALASDPTWDTDNDQTTTFTGSTNAPTVKVAVLGAATLVFNPYKLEAKMTAAGALDNTNGTITVKDQIISKPFEIQNQSNVPLRMAVVLGAKAANSSDAEDAETATIVKAAPAATVTAKQIFVYADFAAFDGTQAQLEKRPEAWLTSQRLVATEATIGDNGWDGTSGGKLEIKNNAGGIYIPAPTTGTPNKQNSIWIKLGGAATATPAQTWAATDSLNVYSALKFVPQGTATLYKLVMAHYSKADDGTVTYTAGVTIGTDTGTTGAPTLTIPYQNAAIAVASTGSAATAAPLWKDANMEEQIEGDIESGYVITITPPKNTATPPAATHTIKSVTFYDANGTKLTTPKAVSTNTKDKTAPWTFTMPAQNLVIDIEMEAVSNG